MIETIATVPQKATLNLDLNETFMQIVLEFAEGCTTAFHLTTEDAMRVRLACEEIFAYLCRTGRSGSEVTIEARNSIYQMELDFIFKAHSFDPYAFNMAASLKPEEAQMDEMGLLIASRSVDRLSISHRQLDGLALVLTKEKSYPPFQPTEHYKVAPLESLTIQTPESEMVKSFARNGISYHDDLSFPRFFRSPARLVDIIASGDYMALVAAGTGLHGGEVGGGIIWRRVGKAMIEFYGPYVFGQPDPATVARSLVENFLAAIAKTEASGTFCRYSTAYLPLHYFELLGSVEYRLDEDIRRTNTFHYRQLKEDEGSHVWASAELGPFLHNAYQRLFLPRKIMAANFDGEALSPHSVMSVDFDRPRDSVTMRPVWDGADWAQNIGGHLKVFKEEHLANIFFELDLGSPWQAKLAPALFEKGFHPVLLLPYAGQADLIVFQYDG